MKVLGNSNSNKWCCFCKHWFDPACSALTPRVSKGMFDVEKDAKCKCTKQNLVTPAIHNCKYFERKF